LAADLRAGQHSGAPPPGKQEEFTWISHTLATQLLPRPANQRTDVRKPTRAHIGFCIVLADCFRSVADLCQSEVHTGAKQNKLSSHGVHIPFVCHLAIGLRAGQRSSAPPQGKQEEFTRSSHFARSHSCHATAYPACPPTLPCEETNAGSRGVYDEAVFLGTFGSPLSFCGRPPPNRNPCMCQATKLSSHGVDTSCVRYLSTDLRAGQHSSATLICCQSLFADPRATPGRQHPLAHRWHTAQTSSQGCRLCKNHVMSGAPCWHCRHPAVVAYGRHRTPKSNASVCPVLIEPVCCTCCRKRRTSSRLASLDDHPPQ